MKCLSKFKKIKKIKEIKIKLINLKLIEIQRRRKRRTWQIPRFTLIQVSFSDGGGSEGGVGDLMCQVISDDLLVGGVESEARGQIQGGWRWFLHAGNLTEAKK